MVQNNSGASGQDNSQNTGQSKKGRGGKQKKRKDNSSTLSTSKDSWKWNTEIDSTTLSPFLLLWVTYQGQRVKLLVLEAS